MKKEIFNISNVNLDKLYQLAKKGIDLSIHTSDNCYWMNRETFVEYKDEVVSFTGEEFFYSAVDNTINLILKKPIDKERCKARLNKLKTKSVNNEEINSFIKDDLIYHYQSILMFLAFPLLLKVAEQGHPEAQLLLGQMFFLNFVDNDRYFSAQRKKAYEYFEFNDKNRESKKALKHCGIGDNPKIAYKWFLKSAEQGNSDAQYAIGEYLFSIADNIDDFKIAGDWLLKSGECKRNAYIRIGIGITQRIGKADLIKPIGSNINNKLLSKENIPEIVKARTLFKKAKEYFNKGFEEEIKESDNLAITYYDIAHYCMEGRIPKQLPANPFFSSYFDYYADYNSAIKYLTKAAEMGHLDSMFELSELYYLGSNHLPTCDNRLFNFCKGFVLKSYLMEELGISTYFLRDYKKAAEWYIKQYEKKDIIIKSGTMSINLQKSFENLGYIYLKAENGIKRDENRAAEWLFRACDLYGKTIFMEIVPYQKTIKRHMSVI